MSQSRPYADLTLKSPVFPGGSLISSIFDRDLMRLSDRGGASGLVGDRWADLTADALSRWPGTTVRLLDGREVRVTRVVRLDDMPEIAKKASRQKLQNPDFIIVGELTEGGHVMFAADAKFSVETASASQVSAGSLSALMLIGTVVSDPLGELHHDIAVADGLFVSPDYSLTQYMFGRKKGYRSVSVDQDQIVLLPLSSSRFTESLDAANFIPIFAEVDGYAARAEESLLLALYYFRLVRAGIGCWFDQNGALLNSGPKPTIDMVDIENQAREFANQAQSGWNMVERWDALAETVRSQRVAVNQVTAVPLVNKDLRLQVDVAAKAAGVDAPSLNRVRRRIGAWFRNHLIDEFGPVMPPVDDFPALLQKLGERSAALRPETPGATKRIIAEMMVEATPSDGAISSQV